jgi:2-succinyl-6-hydroxy-2,4-cyclohexadiene-1-carboxylate synthase
VPWITGHGPEPDLTSECFDDELARLGALIGATTDSPAHLIGYSQGARLALGFALRFPRQVAHIDLIGVNPGLESEVERASRKRWEDELISQLDSRGLDSFLEDWERLPLFASQDRLPETARESQNRIRRSHTAAGLAHALRVLGLSRMRNYWSELVRVDCSVRVICGERDEKFRRIAERISNSLVGAELSILPDVGHNPLIEAPDRLAGLLFA